jgi:hypothetical protein
MAGTRTNLNASHTTVQGYSSAAVTAAQILTEWVCPFKTARIGAIVASAATAGTGGGNTVLDVLLNGTTVFTTAANKPTLLATTTGEFANVEPDGTRTLKAGDILQLKVASISTTGQARLAMTVSINMGR